MSDFAEVVDEIIAEIFSDINFEDPKGAIHVITRGAVHQIFRNGPVEDMHADGKLTEDDMKTLNKYMMDKLGYLLARALEGDIKQTLGHLIVVGRFFGHAWDEIDYETYHK